MTTKRKGACIRDKQSASEVARMMTKIIQKIVGANVIMRGE